MNDGKPSFAVIPETAEQVAQYLLLLDAQDVAK